MKKQFLFLFAVLMTCVSVSVFAQAAQDFTIVNKTGVVIDQLYVSVVDVNDWEEDILGKDVMALDETWEVKFHKATEACNYDLMIKDSDGNSIEWHNIDLCATAHIELHWDGTKAWVTLE